ncbi:amino acid adenylation domain-containing protein [Pleurocapsa sp. FMAR1]|uniref:amino acid adenylation domain-containing protein n=1 Tax=Pleurocapsa sp. FMAR1 TaxID=3040204 RepID=UPI0029C7B35A|nr:amino acid adenylation domain-containing protein [Pleurocapsa sp. FMAR1]
MNYQKSFSANEQSSDIDYWRKQLKNIAPILDFPTDRVRSVSSSLEAQINLRPSANGQNLLTVDQGLNQDLKKIAQQENVSLPIILLGAFQVLLYRYTNQSDVLVGYPNPNLEDPTALETLPIRVTIEAKQKFSELLKIIQAQITEGSNYSNTSTAAIASALNQDFSEFPVSSLFQMLFRFDDGFKISQTKPTKAIPEQELFLDVIDKPNHLLCRFEYNRRLFDESTIQRICDNYEVLLKSIANDFYSSVASLSLLSATETKQVLNEWNQTQTQSLPQCIHKLFEAQVQAHPDAVAIICQGQQLTYSELNTQANQLAHYLQSLGITTGSLVGLCIERSLSMVVAVLGILKAGGAYVPLDINNPPARIAFILEDAQIKTLLTQESLLKKISTEIEQIICVDTDWHLITQQPPDNLDQQVNLSDLAHIVYTSGSTGKPKGVMLSQGNLSHYAQSMQLALDITPADTYLHRGSIALIVSARQLLMPLAQGATALIVTTAETRNPLEFFEIIKRHCVTIVDHVPSFWRNFWGILNQQDRDYRQNLLDNQVRLVAAGGEQVTPEIYQCWRETFKPDVQLANIYGQTEGTGVVTLYKIPEQIDHRFKSLPVGSPIPNMRVYLLDEDLQPVQIGVAAEIHISGDGVAMGYLNRPELTAEKFVENPFVKGERLYKTGDLGRYLSDGTLQFLGRVDRQVNIQGLRIELGEIEAVLSQSELVVEAAVVVRENKLGETLAAYIVSNKTYALTEEMLRNYLEQKLPSYMIPKAFIMVDSFPLTTSGKVDRRALSELNVKKLTEATIAPRDRLESEIIEMLQEILGIESISIEDNFIELGGNSLLAARLVTEIEQRYEQNIPISMMFQASTPEALANIIRQKEPISDADSKCLVPIKQGNSKPILFAIHNLGYGLEFYRPMAKYLDADISIYGLSSSFSNEPDKPHIRDIANLASYYADNIQKVQPQGPYYLMGVSFGGTIAYEIAQHLVSQGHEVRFLGLLDSHCPNKGSAYQNPPLKDRIYRHANKIRTIGASYILDRIKWRINSTTDHVRYNLYKIDWVRENFVDKTSRGFALSEYIQQTKDHQKVNEGYTMQPYPGSVVLFRAAEDRDPKLEWQNFAQGGLNIIDVPGNHLGILQEPNVQVLAEKIRLVLQDK